MNQLDFNRRTAVVTGGAAGIGLAVARRLHASGAKVALWDRDIKALEATRDEHGFAHIEGVDVANAADVERATTASAGALGGIDILVCSAGVAGANANVWEYPIDEWRRVFDINIHGLFYCNRAVVPIMQRNDYGRIVNIASIAGKNGTPNFSAYGASKAAVIALTKALGRELANTEILVNAVCPSAADTDILKQFTPDKVKYFLEQVPKGRFVRTSEIAAMAAWLCSEECSFSTGQLFDISGGRSVY